MDLYFWMTFSSYIGGVLVGKNILFCNEDVSLFCSVSLLILFLFLGFSGGTFLFILLKDPRLGNVIFQKKSHLRSTKSCGSGSFLLKDGRSESMRLVKEDKNLPSLDTELLIKIAALIL